MEELQLALTPARVEQRNFGLWLKSWQVGQVLQALVTDKAPSGQLVLRIAGHQVTATTDIPVQKGAALMLQVSSLSPNPSLRILGTPQTVSSGPDPLSGRLQFLIPHQGDVIDPFRALLDPVRSANILSLLGVKSDALEVLYKNINRFGQLSDPQQLRRAVDRSGLFLEPRLLLEHSRDKPFSPDLKTDLLRLLQQIDQVLAQPRKDAAGAAAKLTVDDPLLAFRKQVEGAISTITLHQLATRTADDRGSCMWLFHLPFQMGESVHCLSLSISKESSGSPAQRSEEEWSVLLNIDLPQLGAIEAELYLRNKKLSVVLFSERQDTAKLMGSQVQQLRNALEARGLEVSVLLSHQGSRGAEQLMARFTQCLDESV